MPTPESVAELTAYTREESSSGLGRVDLDALRKQVDALQAALLRSNKDIKLIQKAVAKLKARKVRKNG